MQGKAKVLRVQIFLLYVNPLTDEACQTRDKVVKAQTDTASWEDLQGELHDRRQAKP